MYRKCNRVIFFSQKFHKIWLWWLLHNLTDKWTINANDYIPFSQFLTLPDEQKATLMNRQNTNPTRTEDDQEEQLFSFDSLARQAKQ